MSGLGYLGPEGTFSHVAALRVVEQQKETSIKAYRSFTALLDAFNQKEITSFILPVENSTGGFVVTSNDVLVDLQFGSIVDELVVPIKLSLLTKKGVEKTSIVKILSHSQPLLQCERFLNKQYPSIETKACSSTSEAAKEVATSNQFLAVVGNDSVLRDLYALQTVDSSIQDESNNQTRFVVVSSDASKSTGLDKTSIVFSAEKEQPGSLHAILNVFAENNVNLTKIESRPTRKLLGEYLFFVDFEGHIDDAAIQLVLAAINSKTDFYKWLGSYPKWSDAC